MYRNRGIFQSFLLQKATVSGVKPGVKENEMAEKVLKRPFLYGLYKYLECELFAVILVFIIPMGALTILLMKLDVDEDLLLFIELPIVGLYLWRAQRWSDACEEWKEEERVARLLEKRQRNKQGGRNYGQP